MIARVQDRAIITYGFSPQADVRAINVEGKPEGTRYDVVVADRKNGTTRTIEGFFLCRIRWPLLPSANALASLTPFCVWR
jgi:UDP-N-acetylmuramate--alanine ligase